MNQSDLDKLKERHIESYNTPLIGYESTISRDTYDTAFKKAAQIALSVFTSLSNNFGNSAALLLKEKFNDILGKE